MYNQGRFLALSKLNLTKYAEQLGAHLGTLFPVPVMGPTVGAYIGEGTTDKKFKRALNTGAMSVVGGLLGAGAGYGLRNAASKILRSDPSLTNMIIPLGSLAGTHAGIHYGYNAGNRPDE